MLRILAITLLALALVVTAAGTGWTTGDMTIDGVTTGPPNVNKIGRAHV